MSLSDVEFLATIPTWLRQEFTDEEILAGLVSEESAKSWAWRQTDRYRSTAEGWVYLMRARDTCRVKIGFTRHSPRRRAAALQIGSPYPIDFVGAVWARKTDEKRMHRLLESCHRHGEWFEPDQLVYRSLLYWFDALAVPIGHPQ